MGGIFVSYRRSDSQGEAGRLFDDLVPVFGESAVFMDVSAIEAGCDFRKAIEEGVAKCGVLLAVMGPEWIDARDESGARRLDNPADFVRIEIASALKRDIPVIPVLVRAAKMPPTEQLPEELKDLAYRNAIELTHARWKSDVQLLIDALRRLLSGEIHLTSIDPAALQRVSHDLAVYIGQIADIVVKRAAAHCTSVKALYLEVASEIDAPDERKKFLTHAPS
jgi:TIR domain